MTDRDDIEMLAAEFVLGTLDSGERAAVDARRSGDAELDARIREWEARLSPLIEHIGEMPHRDVLAEIRSRIAAAGAETPAPRAPSAEIVQLRSRVAGWRMAAIGATAIAAGLAGFIVLRAPLMPPQTQNFVAVFNQDDQPPTFLLSIDLKTRQLTIRPVTAQTRPGKTYQLWIVSDKLAPGPHSLGLLEPPTGPTRKELRDFDPELLQNATFGISIEPEGGSPTGKPTGPAQHGTLIPTAL